MRPPNGFRSSRFRRTPCWAIGSGRCRPAATTTTRNPSISTACSKRWSSCSRSLHEVQMNQTAPTLLVVDDDAMNRDVLSRRLARSGYSVLTADCGAQALEMVNSHRFDAVLLDVMMPGMSGVEALRRLRQSRSMSELPVIMVTANTRSEDVVQALGLG